MEKQGLEGRAREGLSPAWSSKLTMLTLIENIRDFLRKCRAPGVNCPKGRAEGLRKEDEASGSQKNDDDMMSQRHFWMH